MKQFVTRRLITVLCTTGILGLSSHAMAAGFQLFEQDGASVGNYHAGYAAEANDASTAFYNPAGITRIQNQQLVFGADPIITDFTYKGNVSVTELAPTVVGLGPFGPIVAGRPATVNFNGVTDQGGTFSTVPFFHYVAPLYNRIGFGLSVDSPFGLKTSYGNDTPIRYNSTYTSITVIDISPSLGFKITDQASLGVGFDAQRVAGEFDSVGTLVSRDPVGIGAPIIVPNIDSASTNTAYDWGYGYHLGALYEFTPTTRVGVSYHSKVNHRLIGHSSLDGPIAVETDGTFRSDRSVARLTLPAYTAVSIFDQVHPQWAVMGSLIYTQWSSFNTLTLTHAAAAIPSPEFPFFATTTALNASIQENYRNTWNASVGADYYPTDRITLRAGLGFDETPITNRYRNVQLPDNNRYVVALGGHVLATKTLGLDVGWTHIFIGQAKVNPPPQIIGGQGVGTDGHVTGGADVFSTQVTWDIV